MADYLQKRESEVLDMFGFEWNEDDCKRVLLKEGEARGETRGEARGLKIGALQATITNIKNLMKNMNLTAEAAMANLGIDKVDYPKYLALL